MSPLESTKTTQILTQESKKEADSIHRRDSQRDPSKDCELSTKENSLVEEQNAPFREPYGRTDEQLEYPIELDLN